MTGIPVSSGAGVWSRSIRPWGNPTLPKPPHHRRQRARESHMPVAGPTHPAEPPRLGQARVQQRGDRVQPEQARRRTPHRPLAPDARPAHCRGGPRNITEARRHGSTPGLHEPPRQRPPTPWRTDPRPPGGHPAPYVPTHTSATPSTASSRPGRRFGIPGSEVEIEPTAETASGLTKTCYDRPCELLTRDEAAIGRDVGFCPAPSGSRSMPGCRRAWTCRELDLAPRHSRGAGCSQGDQPGSARAASQASRCAVRARRISANSGRPSARYASSMTMHASGSTPLPPRCRTSLPSLRAVAG